MAPRPTDFVPSTEEKELAKASGTEPLVSVFDEELTTLGQAKKIYSRPSAGFGLNVEALRRIAVPGAEDNSHLRVVRDPLTGHEASLPGAEGHCGILGLKRQRGVPKKAYKRFCLQVSDLATPRE